MKHNGMEIMAMKGILAEKKKAPSALQKEVAAQLIQVAPKKDGLMMLIFLDHAEKIYTAVTQIKIKNIKIITLHI
jgi:hypothetical protein